MVKLLFSKSNSVGSAGIRFVTWSSYSHVDVVLPNGRLIGSVYPEGVIDYPLTERLHKATDLRWAEVDADPEKVEEYLCNQRGKPYDVSAIFGFLFRRDWAEDDRWFCSELVAAALTYAGIEIVCKPTNRITPQDLLESPLVRVTGPL